MDSVHSLAAVVLEWLRETTVAVAVLVAVVLVAQRVLHRWLTPRWRYALWLLVLVRLMMPAAPPSPTSVFNLAGDAPAAAVVARIDVPPPPPPARTSALGVAPVSVDLPRVVEPAAIGAAPARAAWPWTTWLALVWLIGAGAILAWTLIRERRFTRRLRDAVRLADERTTVVLAEAAAAAGVRRPPRVLATDAVDAPALAGVVRPRLLLPTGLADRLTDDELRFVFAHELAHLRAGDVLVNWVLAFVQALHWFDPLVWLAFARLRAERESVRDWSALASQPAAAPVAYGDTLLRLLERGAARSARPAAVGILEGRSELRRRITMIAKFQRPTVRAVAAGLAVTAVVAAAALTGAVLDPAPAQAQEEPAKDGKTSSSEPPRMPAFILENRGQFEITDAVFFQQIRVERQRAEAEWEREMRRTLAETRMTVSGEPSMIALIESVRESTGLNFVIQPDARENVGYEPVEVPEDIELSAEQMLRIALRQADLDYCLTENVVFVGPRYTLPAATEQRFYDVRPLLERQAQREIEKQRRIDGDDFELTEPIEEWFGTDELMESVRWFAEPESWDGEGVSLRSWKGLFVAAQSREGHAATEAFLNLLLNRGKRSPEPVPEWKRDIARRLEAPITVSFSDETLADVADRLREETGIAILVSEEHEDTSVTLSLENVTRADAFAWIARMTRLHVTHSDGAIVFTEQPPMHIECYEVQDVLDARDGEGDVDELMEQLRSSVLPVAWEEYDLAAIWYWDGMFVIRQTPEVHAGTVEFLSAVRRLLVD